MKYYLKNHKNLGPCLLVSGQNKQLAELYFGNGKIKNILNDDQFFSNKEISIADFIGNELYEYCFDFFTKSKAQDYINQESIHITRIAKNSIFAEIYGTNKYQVSISIIQNCVSLSCSCPVNGNCKHLYALCKFLNVNFYHEKFHKNDDQQTKANPNNKYTDLLKHILNGRPNFNYYIFNNVIKLRGEIIDETTCREFLKSAEALIKENNYYFNLVNRIIIPLTIDVSFNKNFTALLEEYTSIKTYFKNLNPIKRQMAYENEYIFYDSYFHNNIERLIEARIRNNDDYKIALLVLNRISCRKEFTFEEISDFLSSNFYYNMIRFARSFYKIENIEDIKGNNAILFLEFCDVKDKAFDCMDINFIIKVIDICKFFPNLLLYLTNHFEQINKGDYILILTKLFEKEMGDEEMFNFEYLLKKFPRNKYLLELHRNKLLNDEDKYGYF